MAATFRAHSLACRATPLREPSPNPTFGASILLVRLFSVLLDVRRARQRRWTLVVLSGCALALPVVAWALPHLGRYLCPPTLASALLAGASLVASSAAAAWAGREAHWTVADTVAWLVSLVSLALLAGLGAAPITLGAVLYGLAAMSLAVRVPPTRLVAITLLSGLLGPLLRIATGSPADAVVALAYVCVLIVSAHVAAARATHSLAYVLAEREALLAERRSVARTRSQTPATAMSRTKKSASAGTSVTDLPALPATTTTLEEVGWEGLIEKLRTSLGSLCEPVGVAASVHAEVQGLAGPNARMRTNVLRIAQEATHHALRDTSPTSIAVTLRRGDGGLLLEVQDDGNVGENVRARKGLASLRSRVVPLGGSAELRRGDTGWGMRVRLPCEQLN